MRTLFHFLPYFLSFVILKPILTWFINPKYKKVLTNASTLWKGQGKKYKTVKEDMDYHLEQYFEYHNETFLYALILVVLVYSIVNYKKLTRKQ